MAVIARWGGAGLADETVVTSATAGTGDDPFDSVTASAAHVDTSGLRSPRIRLDQQAAMAAQLVWTSVTLGTLTNYAVRVCPELTAYPSAGSPVLQAYGTGNTVLRWRVDITSTGLLRLRDASNTIVATAGTALQAGVVYRLEVVVSGTTATVTAHVGDAEGTALVTLSGTVGSGADAIRFGNTQASPTWPALFMDEMAVADTAVTIGPQVHQASAAWTAGVQWAAVPHATYRAVAGWSFGVQWAATARTALHGSAAWQVGLVMRIDTGPPAVSAMTTGGVWAPCDLKQMISGSWQ